MSWSSMGLLIFISAFLWAPSRDGLQGVYALAFFIPMGILLLTRRPDFNGYGGWPTFAALSYAGFSATSALWGDEPRSVLFFILQWCVLATFLCGSCLVFSKREINVDKILYLIVIGGTVVVASTFIYHFIFVDPHFPPTRVRLVGWNVFRNPNEIGALCGVVALLAFTIAIQARSLERTWFFYSLCFISCVGLAVSLSRGALLAFVIMSIIALMVVRPNWKIWLPPLLIVIVVVLILLDVTTIRFSYISERGNGLGVRSVIWNEILNRSYNNIFAGTGITKDTTIAISSAIGTYNHAHNAWLDTLYRTGLIGVTLILFHLLLVARRFSHTPQLLPICVWLGYGCICHLFDGRCFFWEIGAKWFLYWIPAGLIVAIQLNKSMSEAR